jgi:UDP-N-acetyl-D-glucosamine/UDP-N-acetyl-D-galactosamine dehydrogenase
MVIYNDLVEKKEKLAIIGLGYVGLPLALEFAKKISVIGFDVDDVRLSLMRDKIDPSKQLSNDDFAGTDILFTNNVADLKGAKFFIVAVPTLLTDSNLPDLTAVKKASEIIGSVINKGGYIVFESTVYPGCTEEDCLPIIENISGLKAVTDFKIGYSPERINPGDKVHTLTNTIKIVSGCDAISLDEIAKTYQLIVQAGVYRAPNIKVAEAGKVLENTQRDLNISLMNELSIIFEKMGINTYDVIEAAGTKWNFVSYSPGLVGGHCIGVAPGYLTYKAQKMGYDSRVIAAGRLVNDDMPHYISKKVAQYIIKNSKNPLMAKVLVLGATYKEKVNDIRDSKVADLVKDLLDYSLHVDLVDYNADPAEVRREYGLEMIDEVKSGYDAVILAVAHNEYKNFSEEYLLSITNENALFADLKGIYRNKFSKLKYWSL